MKNESTIEKTKSRKLAGKKAQSNGVKFEDVISTISSLSGFEKVKFNDYKDKYIQYVNKDRLIITQPVCLDYFKRKKRGKQDFIIRIKNPKASFISDSFEIEKTSSEEPLLEICVQCKCQMSPGSVDEKIAVFFLNILYNKIEQKNIIFLHHGNGIRDYFIESLKELSVEMKRKNSYNLQVMNLNEFNDWLLKI